MAPGIYAEEADVRPLLGNLRTQIDSAQITLAIASATAEANMRIGIPDNVNVDTTDPRFPIMKRAVRYLAAEEIQGGIEDMRQDREDNNKRANELLDMVVKMSVSGTDDIVTSSEYITFPAKEIKGLIYSSKFRGLKASKTLANRFVPLGSMD